MRRTGSISSSVPDRRPGFPIRHTSAPAALLLLLAAGACGAAAPATPHPDEAAREIEAMLVASAEAWNRGDLDGFLADYADDATFVGSRGLIRGAAAIRELYERGYWSSGAPRDALRFELLDVRVTGPAAATAVGRYFLEDPGSGDRTGAGLFTLVLGRRDGTWKILHDHSSAEPAG